MSFFYTVDGVKVKPYVSWDHTNAGDKKGVTAQKKLGTTALDHPVPLIEC